MSEKEKEKKIEDTLEQTSDEDGTKDILDTNVALVIAERNILAEKLSTALDKIEKLEKRIVNAEALIEEDSKAGLIKDIWPRVNVSKSVLAMKKREELEAWKHVLDSSKYTFKAGTPLKLTEDSPEHRLNTMFERNMARIKGGNS